MRPRPTWLVTRLVFLTTSHECLCGLVLRVARFLGAVTAQVRLFVIRNVERVFVLLTLATLALVVLAVVPWLVRLSAVLCPRLTRGFALSCLGIVLSLSRLSSGALAFVLWRKRTVLCTVSCATTGGHLLTAGLCPRLTWAGSRLQCRLIGTSTRLRSRLRTLTGRKLCTRLRTNLRAWL